MSSFTSGWLGRIHLATFDVSTSADGGGERGNDGVLGLVREALEMSTVSALKRSEAEERNQERVGDHTARPDTMLN